MMEKKEDPYLTSPNEKKGWRRGGQKISQRRITSRNEESLKAKKNFIGEKERASEKEKRKKKENNRSKGKKKIKKSRIKRKKRGNIPWGGGV